MSSTSNDGTGISGAGYASAAYIRALGQVPLPFGATGGHLIARPFEGHTDLAGPYPIFSCQNWSALADAVAALPAGPVTMTLVADSFNPNDGWVAKDVLGIDLGITLLSIENLRSGKVWYWFMQNDEIRRAMNRVYIS